MSRESTSIDQFSTAFVERLRAMARTHDVLSEQRWEGVDIKVLIGTALAPYADRNGSNISADGPPVMLRPNVAGTLGMVLFELANNAAKYGALASDDGQVAVSWQADAGKNRQLDLTWKERGGARVAKPSKKGFGTNFIERSLAYELGGSAELKFEPSGLEARLLVPLTQS
jgi:two-component system CheB/CheR fusion protein